MKKPHSVNKVEEGGQILELEDASRWQVYEGFAFRAESWVKGEMINVKQGKNVDYPYTLVNVHKNEQLEARYLGDDE